MFLEVIDAKLIDDFVLSVNFNNGESKIINFTDKLEGEIFQALKDKEYFKNYSIKFNTIEWENGADFAPEYLYEVGEKT